MQFVDSAEDNMVNLTPNSQVEQVAGVRGSTQSPFPPRNHHNWGSRLGRRRDEFKEEPTTLIQLEERAQRSVTLMEKHGAKSERNFEIAMDLLRQQYNMTFKIVCEKCNGCHLYDEILAPER